MDGDAALITSLMNLNQIFVFVIGRIRKYAREITAVGFGILAAYVLFHGAGEVAKSACGNDITATAFSPNNKAKVVLFDRDCGATTAVSPQISILSADEELPNEAGNLFISNRASSENLTATWKNDSRLEISGTLGLEIFRQEHQFGNVQIGYK